MNTQNKQPSSLIYFKEGFEEVLLNEWNDPKFKQTSRDIAEDMAKFCFDHGVKFIITDIMSDAAEDIKFSRVSKSHTEGRAFDFRIHGWSKEFLDKFEKHFETKYLKVAAISSTTKKPELIVYHNNGNGNHGHCQIKGGLP